jgi:hypothetical protein
MVLTTEEALSPNSVAVPDNTSDVVSLLAYVLWVWLWRL